MPHLALARSGAASRTAIARFLMGLWLPCALCFSLDLLAQSKQSSSAFTALSQRAAAARDADRLDEAAGLYSKALAMRPGWEDGWWSLGTLEYDQDHYAKAARAFERLLGLKGTNGTAHAMLGLCQFELGQDGPALKNLLAAEELGVVKDQQLRKVALFHMGVLQLRAGKFSAARETLGKLAADKVDTPELIQALGSAALLLKPRTAPEIFSDTAKTLDTVGKAEALLARKDFGPARELYANATREAPEFPNLHLAFGRFLLDAREADDAVREFQVELNRNPKNVNALLEIATARYQSDSKDGIKYAEEAVKLAPQIPFSHYILGLLRLDVGDAQGAIPELEIANRAFPKEASVYFSLGKAYARVGRKADAASARAAFVKFNKDAPSTGPTTYGEPQVLKLEPGGSSSEPSTERPRP